MPEPLIFEKSSPERKGYLFPSLDVPIFENSLSSEAAREDLPLPELSELDVVRHFTRLSQENFSIDTHFYPLGSCTMKYNPKIHDELASLSGFSDLHPFQPEDQVQGALEIMFQLQNLLAEITGMDSISLEPAAGAHGEFTGLLMVQAYFKDKKESRRQVLVPDSSHGTNPATAAMAGYEVVQIPSNSRGGVELESLKQSLSENVAALMLTNPNTLGLFDENILEITRLVHEKGGILYYDGANLNPILGIARPGDFGFDVVHVNLHKTFTIPHGGGGPGAGPVGVKKFLEPYLPVPIVKKKKNSGQEWYYLDDHYPKSIGKIKAYYGNFLHLVRGLAYILSQGAEGLKRIAELSVLNANYMKEALKKYYDLPYDRMCQHEFVLSAKKQKAYGVKASDIAKRLLDYGFHPPTIYFPLIVEEALMIEPTETESREMLDKFIRAMIQIAEEAEKNPSLVKGAPYTTPISRVDEVLAARKPNLCWC
jgi:glycine dehydrogenase subunit 2